MAAASSYMVVCMCEDFVYSDVIVVRSCSKRS